VEVGRTYRSVLDGTQDPEVARFVLSCLELPGRLVDGYARGEAGSRPPLKV
jgi:hypothetical protein